MKKLLIASSVLAALTANVAFAEPTTQNGGTIEFIGEITDTTCYVDVQGTAAGTAGPADTSNLVLLPVVSKTAFTAATPSTGRTPFFLHVRSEASYANPCVIGKVAGRDSNGVPDGTSATVTKVKAIFGGNLQTGDTEKYASRPGVTVGSAVPGGNMGNVDMVTGYLKNIASTTGTLRSFDDALTATPSDNGAATGVSLRLLDSDYRVIKVGDSNHQIANNKGHNIGGDSYGSDTDTTAIPYFVEYIADNTTAPVVTAGMVRSFVVYDLMYE